MPTRALTELLRGKGAHVDPLACIEDLPAEAASQQVAGFPHSVSQIVFHMNYWMDYELQRIRGQKPQYPEHNAESFTTSTVSVHQWKQLTERFAALLSEFATLASSAPSELDRQIQTVHEGDKKVAGTLEGVLWQMVAHNSYHAGQIAAVRRALGMWPPRSGGDTW